MDRDTVDWKGYWPSCPTPFKRGDESVDLEALRELLEYYVGCGFHGVLINGTVGEWFSQSESERQAVAETAIDQVAGRMTVVIGCTAYTADEVASYGRHAMAAGADGVEAERAAVLEAVPGRDPAVLRRHLRRRRRAAARLQLAARDQRRVPPGPVRTTGRDRQRRGRQRQHPERRAVLRDDATGGGPAGSSGRS